MLEFSFMSLCALLLVLLLYTQWRQKDLPTHMWWVCRCVHCVFCVLGSQPAAEIGSAGKYQYSYSASGVCLMASNASAGQEFKLKLVPLHESHARNVRHTSHHVTLLTRCKWQEMCDWHCAWLIFICPCTLWQSKSYASLLRQKHSFWSTTLASLCYPYL